MEKTLPILDKCNAMIGGVIAVLTYILGEHWYLFAAYLGLNIIDQVTGYMKSYMCGKVNSLLGAKGIIKKFGYWLMILISFTMSFLFIRMGDVIHLDLHITSLLGWFVLASLIINELRSIVENFVEAGYKVPKILTKGLEAANKKINEVVNDEDDSR